MEHEPVVLTGAGCVSALGHSVEAFWSALQDGRCGLGKLDGSALSNLKVSIVGAIPAPDPRHMLDARRLPMLDRFSVLAIVAALEGANRANVFSVPRVMPSADQHGVWYPRPCLHRLFGMRVVHRAIATAVWLLRNSVIDAAVVGGTEAPLTYIILKAWEALRVKSQ